jgi:predicted PurR-regulated permease PerM
MIKRIFGVVAMIFGVLGVLLFLALLWPIWSAHGTLSDGVTSITTNIEGGIERISSRVEELKTSVTGVRLEVQQINNTAERLVQNTSEDERAREGLVSGLEGRVNPLYLRARESYARLQERTDSTRNTIRAFDMLVPRIDIPELEGDPLPNVGARLSEVDTTLTGVRTDLEGRSRPLNQVAQTIVTATERLDGLLTDISTSVDSYTTRLDSVTARIASTRDQVLGWITGGAAILTVVCVYLALLHVSLFAHGYSWFRRPKEVAATEAPLTEASAPA